MRQLNLFSGDELPGAAISPLDVMGALDDAEIRLLARYVFDQAYQRELATEMKIARRTVSFRIHRANNKLRAAGVNLKLPGRGRRNAFRQTAVDPAALDRLIMDDEHVGRWQDGRKIDRDRLERG